MTGIPYLGSLIKASVTQALWLISRKCGRSQKLDGHRYETSVTNIHDRSIAYSFILPIVYLTEYLIHDFVLSILQNFGDVNMNLKHYKLQMALII